MKSYPNIYKERSLRSCTLKRFLQKLSLQSVNVGHYKKGTTEGGFFKCIGGVLGPHSLPKATQSGSFPVRHCGELSSSHPAVQLNELCSQNIPGHKMHRFSQSQVCLSIFRGMGDGSTFITLNHFQKWAFSACKLALVLMCLDGNKLPCCCWHVLPLGTLFAEELVFQTNFE